tara:strand:- start:10 stop:450 length:441 start_codon:yes stop_codon:yes gene_type:complete
MKKWLTNNCEDIGVCTTKTEAFKPVENYELMIETINELYEDNRYKSNHILFTFKKYEDKIVLWGSTYLLQIHDNINNGDLSDLEEEKIISLLEKDGIPKYLFDAIINMEYSLPVGDIIEMMVAPNQKVRVQVTDTEYGNDEYSIEK